MDVPEVHSEIARALGLFDTWVANRVHRENLPGLSIGIVSKSGLLWSKGYGWANIDGKRPATPETAYRITSISKTFTATAVMQLRDNGKLRLDDPVSQYLPWFRAQFPGASQITLYHLLIHGSGLPSNGPTPHWTEDQFQDWASLIAGVQSIAPIAPPNYSFKYSNLTYSLLGGVIEAASGVPYADYIQANILDKLSMKHTRVVPQENDPDLATGYLILDQAYQRKPAPFVHVQSFAPAAGLASNIQDLARYASFHLSDGPNPVLSPHTLHDMHRVHWLLPDWNEGYGLGMMVWRMGDSTVTGHLGIMKGYRSMLAICRDQNLAIIVLTNSSDGQPFQYVQQGYKLLLPLLSKTWVVPESGPNEDWNRYLGSYDYQNGLEIGQVVINEGRLKIYLLDSIDTPLMTLQATDVTDVFTIHGQPGETVRFECDERGNVQRMWVSNEYAVPMTSLWNQ